MSSSHKRRRTNGGGEDEHRAAWRSSTTDRVVELPHDDQRRNRRPIAWVPPPASDRSRKSPSSSSRGYHEDESVIIKRKKKKKVRTMMMTHHADTMGKAVTPDLMEEEEEKEEGEMLNDTMEEQSILGDEDIPELKIPKKKKAATARATTTLTERPRHHYDDDERTEPRSSTSTTIPTRNTIEASPKVSSFHGEEKKRKPNTTIHTHEKESKVILHKKKKEKPKQQHPTTRKDTKVDEKKRKPKKRAREQSDVIHTYEEAKVILKQKNEQRTKLEKQKQEPISPKEPEQPVLDHSSSPILSKWVQKGMIPRSASDSDTDEEELSVWMHRQLGAPLDNREAIEKKRRRKHSVRKKTVAHMRRKELAKPLTKAQIEAFQVEDTTQSQADTWVRRSMRQPSRSVLESHGVTELKEKLAKNDPDMVVLKMKKYCSDCDTPPLVINEVLDALEENTNCEALYIQNFNEGMRDAQILHLLRILKNPRCNIWCINIGETYRVKTSTWERFARVLKKTKITHMYLSEHTITTELKDQMRTTIRNNRQKHTRHCDPLNIDTILRCTHCWWNPINTKALRPYIKEHMLLHDAEAQGLRGSVTGATLT